MAREILVSTRVTVSWKVVTLVFSLSLRVTVIWVRDNEKEVMATEVKSVSTRARNSSSLRINTSPVISSPPSDVTLPELARLVSRVFTSVMDFVFTVSDCRLIRIADEASSVLVTELDPEVIWVVVASDPVCFLKSS